VPNERVVELVGDAAGRRIEIDPAAMPPRKWDAGLAGSTERARRTLGWQARTALSEGIGMTLALARDETRNTRLAAAR
jgi:nucleoside-diphosphate-sugar epimerase